MEEAQPIPTQASNKKFLTPWGQLLYALLVTIGGAPYYFFLISVYSQLRSHTMQNDFVLFYAASVMTAAGKTQPINVYDHLVFTDYVNKFYPPHNPPIVYFMLYPPYFLTLLEPLRLMELHTAWLVWIIASSVLIVTSLLLLCRDRFGVAETAIFILATLTSSAVWYNFVGGQTAAILLFGLTLTWMLLKEKKYLTAGLATGIVLVKLQFAPLVLLVGLLRGRLRYVLGVAIASAVLVAFGIMSVGVDNTLAYPASLQGSEDYEVHEKYLVGSNFRAAIGLLPFVTPDNATPIAIATFALATIATLYLWLKVFPRLETKPAFEICASITTLLLVMFSIHANMYDYLSTAIGFVWLWHWTSIDPFFTENARLKWLLRGTILAFPVITQPFVTLRILDDHGWSMGFFAGLAVLICASFSVSKAIKRQD
jgi:hypothetical protein